MNKISITITPEDIKKALEITDKQLQNPKVKKFGTNMFIRILLSLIRMIGRNSFYPLFQTQR